MDMDIEKIKQQYEELVKDGVNLVQHNRSGPQKAKRWCTSVRKWLERIEPEKRLAGEVIRVMPAFGSRDDYYGRGLRPNDKKRIQKILDILVKAKEVIPILAADLPYKPALENIRKVFIIYGRNEPLKNSVEKFIKKLGLEAVVFNRQPNKGRSVFEKFKDLADQSSFAITLYSGDDRGGLAPDPPDSYAPRARQNVIFEMGYFLAKIGKERVVAIVEEGVEFPSDYDGVLHIRLDDKKNWQRQLTRELKHAHLPIQ